MFLLTTAFFPPIEYFAVLAKCSISLIDATEHYQKQSWRNRCRILTSNGPEDLRFPIVHDGKHEICEVLLDYKTDWVRRTEYAIDTAYYNSPFFEYYRDELFAILDSKPATLWELDSRLMDFFCRKIGIPTPLALVGDGQVAPLLDLSAAHVPSAPIGDCERLTIHPKVESSYEARPYWQVFREKFGFVPGLSIMDLLFNEGPESICYLK